jgi:LmbE family N-acetylglucosaminyl deacetylase
VVLSFLLLIPGIVLALWLAALLTITDRAIPRGSIRGFRKVLAVFPHADDETVSCGGTLRRLSAGGAEVTLLLLTTGERGNPNRSPDPILKGVRKNEAELAVRLLGLSRLIQEDFGDGQLSDRREDIEEHLVEIIRTVVPDLIVTYDRAGLDGHPDHVACAEAMIELKARQSIDATLWLVALPKRVVRLLQMARQLPREPLTDAHRSVPALRIFIGSAVVPKIRAWYAYRSQRGAIAKGLGRLVPIWFAISAFQFEYFAEVR